MNEINGLHIAVLVVSGFLLLLLLFYLLKSRNSYGRINKQIETPETAPLKTRPCPLCGEPLKRGETVHSILYQGKPDSLMEIYGCPFCEKPEAKNKRTCPVCKKEMQDEDFLIARVFDKPEKKHVHVLGCTSCYSGRSRTRDK
jgi:ssDNA-binding Zn-finger/Zn-ribbon topoisomerase 1